MMISFGHFFLDVDRSDSLYHTAEVNRTTVNVLPLCLCCLYHCMSPALHEGYRGAEQEIMKWTLEYILLESSTTMLINHKCNKRETVWPVYNKQLLNKQNTNLQKRDTFGYSAHSDLLPILIHTWFVLHRYNIVLKVNSHYPPKMRILLGKKGDTSVMEVF